MANWTKNASERFADAFTSAVLMPMDELKIKVIEYRDHNGNVSFDDVLKIADYFGVSFESCVRRSAYIIHAVEGDIESKELTKRIRKYKPDIFILPSKCSVLALSITVFMLFVTISFGTPPKVSNAFFRKENKTSCALGMDKRYFLNLEYDKSNTNTFISIISPLE